jgi:hypothetical protein
MLKRKSGHNDCIGTGGWFSLWKCWFCILLKRHMTEKTVLLLLSADQWNFTKLPEFHKKCADIYSAVETSLFYCATLYDSIS